MSRLTLLYVLSTILLLPFALGSAAAQFKLDASRDASNCFVACHKRVVATVQIEGTGGHNAFQWITRNCESEAWKSLMSQCLPITCTSAPDVAYAVEYGERFCARAGIKDVVIPLPQEYLDGANGTYFKSEEFLASSAVVNTYRPLAGMTIAGLVVLALGV